MNKVRGLITNHKIETGAVVALICAWAFIFFAAHSCVKDIREAGGIRTIIVESGKEMKLLSEDINKAYEKEKNNPYR